MEFILRNSQLLQVNSLSEREKYYILPVDRGNNDGRVVKDAQDKTQKTYLFQRSLVWQ